MDNKIKILHLEDSLNDSELIHSIIESEKIKLEYFLAENEKSFINFLENKDIDIILSDYSLPDYTGTEALKVAREKYSHIPFIFVSGTMGEDAAINAMKYGASDYVLKNKLERLVPAIKRAMNEYELEIKRKQSEIDLKEKNKLIKEQKDEIEKRAAELFIANKELIFQNLEKEKQAKELIKAKEHAEESDHLKTAFLHNISHEIRTPMNAIVGFSGFLNNSHLLPEKRQHFIDIIVQSSEQLLSIISDIVSIATIEAGQERITEKSIDLNETLLFLHEQFLLKANQKNVGFTMNSVLPKHEVWIKTDETKLLQVLTNLISNALKFTIQGYVKFGAKINDKELEFFVEDTGIGIPSEMHEEIFKRFRQVETSAARQYGGSGLGLSISKAYVELLGGKIWFKSELGKGSTFFFTIPYIKALKNILSEMQFNSKFKSEIKELKTLLIAEDEDSNFMLLEELLSGSNMHIIRALNGLEAVEICHTNTHVDLVLMDIKMPIMDGYEATKQIKSFMPNLPIIAQTAYFTDIDKSKALACGCIDFISKPIKRESLFSKIEKQLGKAI